MRRLACACVIVESTAHTVDSVADYGRAALIFFRQACGGKGRYLLVLSRFLAAHSCDKSLAIARSLAVRTLAPLALVLADARSLAVLALAPLALVLAENPGTVVVHCFLHQHKSQVRTHASVYQFEYSSIKKNCTHSMWVGLMTGITFDMQLGLMHGFLHRRCSRSVRSWLTEGCRNRNTRWLGYVPVKLKSCSSKPFSVCA